MSANAGLSENASFVWVQNFEEPNDFPLMNSFNFIVALDALYLLAVLKILPDYMKNREPFQLRTSIILYNAFEVIASSYFVYLGIEIFILRGILTTSPIEEDIETRKKMLYFLYVYFLSKISEFLDTIFFILRKKYNQVTFLHVYHHAATMIGTWCLVKYAATQSSIFGATLNSLVHVVMYFYYAISAMGPQYAKYLTWKKYITTFQLVQFASIFLHQCIALVVQRGPHSIFGVVYILYSDVLFFYLFWQFYQQSYEKSKKEAFTTKNGVTSNGVLKTNEEKVKAQ